MESTLSVDEIKQAIELQKDEIRKIAKALNDAHETQNRLYELYWLKRFGVQIGTEIICKHRGKYTLCRISSYNHTHRWLDTPWFFVNVKTRNGWSKNEVHSYEWSVAAEATDNRSTEEFEKNIKAMAQSLVSDRENAVYQKILGNETD